jgi:hypothetical protein
LAGLVDDDEERFGEAAAGDVPGVDGVFETSWLVTAATDENGVGLAELGFTLVQQARL